MNRKLNVYLYGEKAGVLSEDEMGKLQFQYEKDASHKLSVRLPVRAIPYDDHDVEPFFSNLTPEGEVLKIIAKEFHTSEKNTFSILDKIGGDCAGAVSLYENEMSKNMSEPLREITEEEIANFIDELPTNPLLVGIKNAPRLSLAGAQSKFAIRKEDGKYRTSNDLHPTTHIIKIESSKYPNLLENELFCMKLAKRMLQPNTIDVEMYQVKGRKYIEIKRYDRRRKKVDESWFYDNDGSPLGVSQVFRTERIHQEDFCQALGYLPQKKYELDGGPSIKILYNAIIKYSHVNILNVINANNFLKLLMFNYLIGNADAHAKNFSLLHRDDDTITLAPAYDLVSIDFYKKYKKELKLRDTFFNIAMKINNKQVYDKVAKKDWLALYEQLNVNPTITMREMKRNFADIINVAEILRNELNSQELTKSEIYDDIIAIIKKRFAVLFS